MNSTYTRIVLIVLAMSVLALIISSLVPQAKISAVFADGFKVTLEKVTYGRRHEFHQGSKLYYSLKENWPRFLPSLPSPQYSVGSFDTDTDTIVPWISLRDASGKYVDPKMEILVEDEHGCVFRNSGISRCMVGKMHLECTKLEVYPRRQNQFKMRFSRGTNVVSFLVPNPKIIHPVEWKPSPLPVTANVGDFATTIVELNYGQSPDRNLYFAPKWETCYKGQPTSGWSFLNRRYLDVTGNSGCDFLCPYEPALKLCLDFLRNSDAAFSSNELWALPAMPLPGSGRFVSLSGTRMVNGATVRLESLAGPGIVTYSNAAPIASKILGPGLSGLELSTSQTGPFITKSKADAAVLAITIDGMKRDQLMLIYCFDDEGKKTNAEGYNRRGNLCYSSLPVDTTAKSVQINIVVHALVRVDFLLKPSRTP